MLVRIVGYLLKMKDDRIESLSEQATARWDAHLSVITQSGESHVETKELLEVLVARCPKFVDAIRCRPDLLDPGHANTSLNELLRRH